MRDEKNTEEEEEEEEEEDDRNEVLGSHTEILPRSTY